MDGTLVYTGQAPKDARKIELSGLRLQAQRLLDTIVSNPFQTPPPYEKRVGDLTGAFSRRINVKVERSAASNTLTAKGR